MPETEARLVLRPFRSMTDYGRTYLSFGGVAA